MPPEVKPPSNIEIEQALKEFEMKQGAMPQGAAIQSTSISDGRPKMVRLVMKLSGGAIKEQKTAEYVLLGFVVLAIAVSLFLFLGGGSDEADLLQQKLYREGESVLR